MSFLTLDLTTFGSDTSSPQLAQAVASVLDDVNEGRLPALSIVQTDNKDLEIFSQTASHLSAFETLVVLGTGGSSLGAKSLMELVRPPFGWKGKQIHFVENVDPHTLSALFTQISPAKTGYIVISKSGSTAETLAQFVCVLERMRVDVGADHIRKHVLIITENNDTPLRALAYTYNIPLVEHPKEIGGRFSVFSCVGMIPALLMGVDVAEVRRGATHVLQTLIKEKETSPIARSANVHVTLAKSSCGVHVMMPYCDRLSVFTAWWRQLWAESLGKAGQGTFPLPALGTIDQHSQLQLFLEGTPLASYTLLLTRAQGEGPGFHLKDMNLDARLSYFQGRTMGDLLVCEQEATLSCLRRAGRHVRVITMDTLTPEIMGALMMQSFLEVILVARLMGVNAFDQSAVEESKILTRKFMQEGLAA